MTSILTENDMIHLQQCIIHSNNQIVNTSSTLFRLNSSLYNIENNSNFPEKSNHSLHIIKPNVSSISSSCDENMEISKENMPIFDNRYLPNIKVSEQILIFSTSLFLKSKMITLCYDKMIGSFKVFRNQKRIKKKCKVGRVSTNSYISECRIYCGIRNDNRKYYKNKNAVGWHSFKICKVYMC